MTDKGITVPVPFSEKELGEAYSADLLSTVSSARDVLSHRGHLWVVVSCWYGPCPARFNAVQVVPDRLFDGLRCTYQERCQKLSSLERSDALQAAALRLRFYDGMGFRFRGSLMRLTGCSEQWSAAAQLVPEQVELFD